ncbi:MAG: histidinol-phosphate transaminase [Chloroflexi bacterium]|nr:histidinol-phosphate transaminase [Chloroflexota bacterium]MDA1148062.1 histidinol-phosphate transaminase [Chloroflexota bacterium]MQC82570.1 histidinol-phosphate transaminase [Chloroflexota bacterium]MQC83181.1 histidinol-phosphate transaminase [Chloroflexota bacterium]PKB56560.1 MAG: histidinol-phosphate transaminase [SAR202 cluster bacterium Casp-Chloro-G1]
MARFDPIASLRPHIRNLPPYEALEDLEELAAEYGFDPADVLKLDGNENPFGPSPKALAALQTNYGADRYADAAQFRLRSALSSYVGVPPENIVAGAGSDELIDLIFRLWVQEGDTVVTSGPTFGMYAFDSGLNGSTLVDVPRNADWAVDPTALIGAALEAKAVFLASPNNPTGNLLQPDLLDALLETGALVVLDEAYIEFAGVESAAVRSITNPALLVLRTFSKWGGIAGMRVGYATGTAEAIDVMLRAKQPYNISAASQAAALATLEDVPILDERARILVAQRDRLADAMRQAEWLEPFPSDTNFLLVRVHDGRSGREVSEALRRHGIFVRTYGTPRLADCFRISMGTPEQTDRIIAAISEMGATSA